MNLWIGTSGFQYSEWKGKFYPADLSTAKMLAYYSSRLSTTEVNYSFRRIPSAEAVSRWAKGTPDRFRFSFKAPQKVTHIKKLRDCAEVLNVFSQAIVPMADKLGAVLFQLPPSLKKDTALLEEFMPQIPAAIRPAFEFRHQSWFDDEIFRIMRARNAALCIAETEDFETPTEATADFGYLRLRREDYEPSGIQRWVEFTQSQQRRWSDGFIYFKHEERAVGPEFAEQFAKLAAD